MNRPAFKYVKTRDQLKSEIQERLLLRKKQKELLQKRIFKHRKVKKKEEPKKTYVRKVVERVPPQEEDEKSFNLSDFIVTTDQPEDPLLVKFFAADKPINPRHRSLSP